MKNYKVGQVLYLIGEASSRIIPIQVIEEVTRVTIEGKIKTYTVMLPDKEKTTADINDIKGNLFESKEKVRRFMLDNTTAAIDKMIADCASLSYTVFDLKDTVVKSADPPAEEPAIIEPQLDNVVQNNFDDNIIKVDLGDGTIAKMSATSLENIGIK